MLLSGTALAPVQQSDRGPSLINDHPLQVLCWAWAPTLPASSRRLSIVGARSAICIHGYFLTPTLTAGFIIFSLIVTSLQIFIFLLACVQVLPLCLLRCYLTLFSTSDYSGRNLAWNPSFSSYSPSFGWVRFPAFCPPVDCLLTERYV